MIDAHHHLWNYSEAEYGWITEDMQSIRRSFRADELDTLMQSNGITGTVAVQARTCLEENDFLLEEAANSQVIRGIVGWLDLKSAAVGEQLDQYRPNAFFKGVREVIQGAADEEFLTNDTFDRGIREVTRRGLSYDLLIFQNQLEAATAFVKRHPDQPIVLDHAAKPEIRADRFPAEWESGIRALAALGNTCCKISGLATEVRDSSWNPDIYRRYLDVLLDAFGPSRLMFGSDWPVCLLATSHSAWVETVASHLKGLSTSEQEAISTRTATAFYRLA